MKPWESEEKSGSTLMVFDVLMVFTSEPFFPKDLKEQWVKRSSDGLGGLEFGSYQIKY